MRHVVLPLLITMAMVFTLTPSATATLVTLGTGTIVGGDAAEYNLIYDSEQDITWLDYTKSLANWDAQIAWADALVVNFGSTTLSDWRLPSAGDYPQEGFNITSSEMGHLFFESLGNVAFETTGYGLQNTGDFENLENNRYWTGTDYSNPDLAWYFQFALGYQYAYTKEGTNSALAVLPGNPTAAVPVPAAVWLLGSGLMGLIGIRRRAKK